MKIQENKLVSFYEINGLPLQIHAMTRHKLRDSFPRVPTPSRKSIWDR